MRNNKKVLVVISVILILVIASAVFAYLYIATDTFKSNKELFAKYFGQNEEMLQKITDLKTIEVYKNLKSEGKYEANTNMKMSYSEGGEISNPLNNLTVKLNVQKDNEEQYTYIDGQILYEDEEYLETELIKEQDVYGIRFTDVIKQFITVENDENFDEIMNDIGLTTEQSEELINLLEGKTNNNEEITTLKGKYLNIVTSTIANGEFSKQKNTVITHNNNTVKTNAYSVLLSNELVENFLITILENVKNETEILQKISDKEAFLNKIDEIAEKIRGEIEIPTIKITVYENKQKTIRTLLEIGKHNILIENTEQNKELTTKINYSNVNEEKQAQTEIVMNRANDENSEKFEITANMSEGENSFSITLSNLLQLTQEKIQVNTKLGYTQGITTVEIEIENNMNIGKNFEKSQTLSEQNSRSLNSIKSEKRKDIIDQLKDLVLQKTNERMDLLNEKMGLNNSENEIIENEISQTEINKFNAKFEFYTGEEVSTENVKSLLEVVKNNLKSYEFLNNEVSSDTGSTIIENNKIDIKLNIEKDKTDEEGINKVLEKINTSRKYKVSIKYNDTNGLIDYITITEI